MRAPFQDGDFPGPVKYGYLNVGVVESGPPALRGRTVFTLFPHQSAFVVPESAVEVVPEGVPARRAVLAGAVETAVNVLWDAAPLVGDRITVVGAGMIGCAVARLARGIPGVEVMVVDVDRSKAAVCGLLGVAYAHPDDAPLERDIVVDASGSEGGLQFALEATATEGEIIVASWFGDRPVRLDLGGDFHSRRLTIRSSQVGMVSPRRRGSRSDGGQARARAPICCRTPRSTRCSPTVLRGGTCPTSWRPSRTDPRRDCATRSTGGMPNDVLRHRARSHHDRAQPHR